MRRRLGLHTLLAELIDPGKEQVPWDLIACILVIARFCGNKSELEVAERWYQDSALEDLLAVPWPRIDDNRLYRGLDVLHRHKEELCGHLMERYQSWFGVEFEFLLYDVTTVEEMVELMEQKYGLARRIWVLDRGMVSEENMDFLRERNARYIVGTPKSQLRTFEREYLEERDWTEVQPGVEVKLVPHPDGQGQEQYVICRSAERAKKEAAMLELKRTRLLSKLGEIDRGLQKRPQKIETIERRVGRWLGRYPAAERCVSVEVLQDELSGKAIGLRIEEKQAPLSWAQRAHGGYLLRTNCTEEDPRKLWRWYMQLSQAEDAFRISKSDLHLRPVYHQRTERVEAHILVEQDARVFFIPIPVLSRSPARRLS